MANRRIAQLEELEPREIWSDEAREFTPWLAEHLEDLGRALSIELHLVEAEGAVGPFAADVIADSENGLVVIENQLEQSDHTHLGQLLTYAAGRDARTLIWITPDFRPEHRDAIDWLNRWTGREIAIYGVVVRVVQVDGSAPAPHFFTIASPGNARRAQTIIGDSAHGEVERWLLERLVPDADGYVVIEDAWKQLANAFSVDEDGSIYGVSRATLPKLARRLFTSLPPATQRRANNRKRGWQGWSLSSPTDESMAKDP